MTKDGARAKTAAIDHVLGNLLAYDKLLEGCVEYDTVSDHFPVVVTLKRCFQAQKSPSPPIKICDRYSVRCRSLGCIEELPSRNRPQRETCATCP